MRPTQKRQGANDWLSIPEGAIKIPADEVATREYRYFQYQKVRLKFCISR